MDWPTRDLNRDLRRIGAAIVAVLVTVGAALGSFVTWLLVHHRTVSRSSHRR